MSSSSRSSRPAFSAAASLAAAQPPVAHLVAFGRHERRRRQPELELAQRGLRRAE